MCATYHGGVPSVASPAPSILAAQVARLFFDRQLSKVEIAARLGISRFRVARLIDGALADGLVRIEFRDIPADDRELAGSIEARFGIDLCAVAAVPDDGSTADDGSLRLARLAGAVIDGLIGPGDVIGIAWGSTLAAVVREIPARVGSGLEVVQLAGSSVRLGRERDAGELARTLADRLGATHHAIYAPAFVENATLRLALAREPDVADAVARFGALTLAVVGIGAMPSGDGGPASSLLRSGLLDDAVVARLAALGAVGDLVVHPFDSAGRLRGARPRRAGGRHRRRRPAARRPGRRRRQRRRQGRGDPRRAGDRPGPDAGHRCADGERHPGGRLMDRLRERICLITGSTGIAAAAAERCAAEGAAVFVVSRSAEHARDLADRLIAGGARAGWVAADLSVEDEAEAAVAAAVERFGRIDGCFSVAGGSGRRFGDGPIDTLTMTAGMRRSHSTCGPRRSFVVPSSVGCSARRRTPPAPAARSC